MSEEVTKDSVVKVGTLWEKKNCGKLFYVKEKFKTFIKCDKLVTIIRLVNLKNDLEVYNVDYDSIYEMFEPCMNSGAVCTPKKKGNKKFIVVSTNDYEKKFSEFSFTIVDGDNRSSAYDKVNLMFPNSKKILIKELKLYETSLIKMW